MTFTALDIAGVWLVEPDVFHDDRGAFVRAWLPEDFAARGLDTQIAQCSMATNHRRGTIRGMHYQLPPVQEVKLIRATRGALYDVAVDLRPNSPTFCRWVGVELTSENRRSLYLPHGVAHGYQTLVDDTEALYFVSAAYTPSHQRGVRWNDPAFGIVWPLGPPTMINERDATYPDFTIPSVV